MFVFLYQIRLKVRGRDLKDSGLDLIEPRLPDDDGYGILDTEYSQKYDLILLDPYREFLRDECRNSNKRFDQIRNEVNKNSDLFIAVFVLDMNTNNSVGRNFAKYKESPVIGLGFLHSLSQNGKFQV